MSVQPPTNPALRMLALGRRHYRLIIAGAILGSAASLAVNFMSPELYRSESIVEMRLNDRGAAHSLFMTEDPTEVALNKAIIQIQSPEVLRDLATWILENDVDLRLAFPRQHRWFDFQERLNILSYRSGLGQHLISGRLPPIDMELDETAARLSHHISVKSELGISSLRISYDASEPSIARNICQMLTERFIDFTGSQDRAEFIQQIAYIEQSIKSQLLQISVIEDKRQDILEIHPEMTAGGDRGSSILASQFMKTRESLSIIQQDLSVNNKIIRDYKTAYASDILSGGSVAHAVRAKLQTELAELELRRMELIRVSGYDEQNARVQEINSRIGVVKALLSEIETSGGSLSATTIGVDDDIRDVRDLPERTKGLAQQNRRLKLQETLVQEELKNQDSLLKQGLRVEFELASLNRTLSTHERILTDLQTSLENARIQLASLKSSAKLQRAATLPVIPFGLSARRRAAFGLIISAAFVLSALYLVDLRNPKILLSEDFSALQIRSIAKLKIDGMSIHHFAKRLCILSNPNDHVTAGGCAVIIAHDEIGIDVEQIVLELAEAAAREGRVTTVLMVGTDDSGLGRLERATANGIEIVRMQESEVIEWFPGFAADLRKRSDLVLISAPSVSDLTARATVFHDAEHVFYVSQLGTTSLESIARNQEVLTKDTLTKQHAILLEA